MSLTTTLRSALSARPNITLVRRLSTGPLITGGLVAGFLTVISLVLPWFDILGRERSSIDILRSASVLDVIEGGLKVVVISGWLLAPVVVSAAMLLAASGRHRTAALLLLPVGLITVLVVGAGFIVDEVGLAWGAFVGLLSALPASILAMMVLASPRPATPTGGST